MGMVRLRYGVLRSPQDVAKAIQTKPFDRSHESLRPRHRGGGKGGKGGAGGAAWRGCAATALIRPIRPHGSAVLRMP